MPSGSEVKFEIGQVLFIDIVGYSKFLINEQSEQIQTLKKIVRGTEQCRIAEAEGKLLRLPTGDGGALVFRNSPEAPVLCALEIGTALKNHPELHVRMGIYSGPVNEITDLNAQANIAGAGINIAQRVMDCGDAGHILLAKRVADDLEQYPQWRPLLHELGECEVKHGMHLRIVSLYNNETGNPQVPKKFQVLKQQRAQSRWSVIAAVMVLLAGMVAAFVIVSKKSAKTASIVPDKSIAVLPFENLSDDKTNAYFADGIQEEILTRLASIGQVKVISRSSTAKYQSKPEDLRTVARELGIATVVEGSVQKAGNQVRVNVQLINAATDAHLWANTYDRKLNDVFAVETEIATKIADTLQTKLTGAESAAVAAQPTQNPEAHELYLKARYLTAKRTHEDSLKAIEYYKQAVSEDPNFALAYAGLAEAYVLTTSYSRLPSADVLPKAKIAAEKGLAINPNLAEARTSLGVIALSQLDFATASQELERAITVNPNFAEAHYYLAYVLISLGQFDAAITEAKRAVEIDPLSIAIRVRLGSCYRLAGRFTEAIDFLRKMIELDPTSAQAQDQLGVALETSGDLDGAVAQFQKSFQASGGDFHSLVFLSHLYGIRGERDKAIQTFEQSKKLEQKDGAEWAYGYALISLGLGDKESAIQWLERSYEAKESFALLLYIRVDPLLEPLRGDPRFEALAEKILPARELKELNKQ